LQRQLDQRPLRYAPEPSPRERLHKAWRRHPRVAVALIAVAVLLPLLGLYAAKQWELAEQRRGRAWAEALATAEQFRREKQTALMLLGLHDLPAAERAEGSDLARRALERYRVTESDGPTPAPALALPPEPDRDLVGRDIGKLLLARADAAVLAARRDSTPEGLRDAERWNALAEPYLGDGPGRRAWLMQRASLANLAGERERAEKLRSEARTIPARSALDLAADINAELRQGKFRAALTLLDDALRRDPRRPCCGTCAASASTSSKTTTGP
jgi:hypothetical protein